MDFLIEKVSRDDPECREVNIPPHRRNAIVTDEDLVRLVDALKRNPHVRKIDIYARRSPELFQHLAALFRVNRVIQYVRLPMSTSNEELLLIEQSLRHNTAITTLVLEGCGIQGRQGGETIRTLLLNNGTITEISLGYSGHLGSEGAASIARGLRNEHCLLKKLKLCFCGIGNDGARELSNALENNNVLEDLNIGYNLITFTGFRHVFEMIETNSFLQVLDLSGNRLNEGRTNHETVGDLVLRALQCNTSLQELNFESCGVPAADVSRIFETLARDNKTLSRLYSRGNQMDEASTKSFSCFLPEMKGLEEVHFSWYHGVSATVLRGYLEGLLNNKSLVRIEAYLDEDDHRLLGEGSQELWRTWSTFVARRNKMRPLLEGNSEACGGQAVYPAQPVPQSLWPYLLKWCDDSRYYSSYSNLLMEAPEAQASLMHRVLCARANDICGLTTTKAKLPALEA